VIDRTRCRLNEIEPRNAGSFCEPQLMIRVRLHRRGLLVALAMVASAPAIAQSYPAKPIRFVVPFAPGGGTDIIARILAQRLNESLGQPVVADNRGGAGSTVGTDIVCKAPPDGYTLLLANISLAFNAWLYKSLPYNAIKDLAPVSMVAVQPNIVVIHPSVPAKSIKEFADYARANPGKLSFASAGAGSGTHLAGELLKDRLKIDMLHVPYKGTGPAVTDLIGGQVQVMISTFASALPHVRSGRLRALGVTSAKRSTATPEVPTLIEAGVPDYDYSTWYALFAPAGTPRPVIDKLNQATRQVLAADDMKQKYDAQGVEAWSNTAAELSAYLREETEKWGKVVRAAGIPQL
jgi:tripartite-type tricarboxylate transporter receptor subunit TctC